MEGVQEPLARLAAKAYISQAAVMQTANTIDHGVKPAVPSAILKSQLTEFQREMMIDAMDVHGGRTVTLGPRNYSGDRFQRHAGVDHRRGRQIMTRNLMIFGQGAIRCHPYVLDELAAKDNNDFAAFDKLFFRHTGLIFGNAARAFTQALGLGRAEGTVRLPGQALCAGSGTPLLRLRPVRRRRPWPASAPSSSSAR